MRLARLDTLALRLIVRVPSELPPVIDTSNDAELPPEKSNAEKLLVPVSAEGLSAKLKLIGAAAPVNVDGELMEKSKPSTALEPATAVGLFTEKSKGVIALAAVIEDCVSMEKSNGTGGPEVRTTDGVADAMPGRATPTAVPAVAIVEPTRDSTADRASRFTALPTRLVRRGCRFSLETRRSPSTPPTCPVSETLNP